MNQIICFLTTQQEVENVKDKINMFEKEIPNIIRFGRHLLIAILVFLIGRQLVKWTDKLLEKSFKRSPMDESVSKFLLSMIRVVANIALVLGVASILGVDKASIVALIGSVGLAIGLALQGSLSNFAGGVLILLMKPFRIGDYIITNGNEGVVSNIDIFYTKLLTMDNRLVILPNGELANSSLINVSKEPIRRLDLDVSIDYSENLKKVKNILEKLGKEHELVLKDHDVEVFVASFNPSAIKIGFRLWAKKEDYWELKCELLEQIKTAFDENSIIIPFDQLDVNISQKNSINTHHLL